MMKMRTDNKIDAALDMSFIYEKVNPMYSHTVTNSIDPVVLFKIILIQYIFRIHSMRRIIILFLYANLY